MIDSYWFFLKSFLFHFCGFHIEKLSVKKHVKMSTLSTFSTFPLLWEALYCRREWKNTEETMRKILIGFQTSAMLILILREQEMVWKVMEGEGGSYSSIWKSQQKPRWWKWNTLLQKSDFKKSKIFRKIKSISFKPKIVYEHNTFLKFSFRKF